MRFILPEKCNSLLRCALLRPLFHAVFIRLTLPICCSLFLYPFPDETAVTLLMLIAFGMLDYARQAAAAKVDNRERDEMFAGLLADAKAALKEMDEKLEKSKSANGDLRVGREYDAREVEQW